MSPRETDAMRSSSDEKCRQLGTDDKLFMNYLVNLPEPVHSLAEAMVNAARGFLAFVPAAIPRTLRGDAAPEMEHLPQAAANLLEPGFLQKGAPREPRQSMTIRLRNPQLVGLKIHEIPGIHSLGITISRIKHPGQAGVAVAHSETVLRRGDILLAEGAPRRLREFALWARTDRSEDAPMAWTGLSQ
jgi:TrkA-C domain